MDTTHNMSAYDCYREYLALKQHFTKPGYDYTKFNGKVRASVQSFDRRKDKLYFQKLAKHEDPRGLIVSNLVRDPKVWVKELAYGDLAEKTFREWQRRGQSMSYVLRQELQRLGEDLDKALSCAGGHPPLMRECMAGRVSIEVVVIVTGLTGCMGYWRSRLSGDPVAEGEMDRVEKLRPFVVYDADKCKKIVIDHFSGV